MAIFDHAFDKMIRNEGGFKLTNIEGDRGGHLSSNGEVRGASRLAGEASSGEAATSTVVLCGADLEE